MKLLIKKILGRKGMETYRCVKFFFGLVSVYVYDFGRFFAHSGIYRVKSQKVMASWLLQDAHRLEKGMALPEPRIGFGVEVAMKIAAALRIYVDKFGKDAYTKIAAATLIKYLDFNEESDDPVYIQIRGDITSLFNTSEYTIAAGLIDLGRDSFTENRSFEDVFRSRHSVRQFEKGPVDHVLIEKAVRVSMKSPSVCNRQHWRVHILEGSALRDMLVLQNGNAGFRQDIHCAAVVTSELPFFVYPAERYQPYIDGGLFCMSLMLSLHDLGIGSCALNWSASVEHDKKAHRLGIFERHESIIMMIALGNYRDEFQIAASPRLPLEDILEFHK